MNGVVCKDCRYFEDVEPRWIPSPTEENVFNKVEVLYGICNNVKNEEYRCPCWEHCYCKTGRKKKV